MRGAGVGQMQPVPRGKADARFTGRSREEAERLHRAWLDAQPLTTRCAFCDWTHTGTAVDGRVAALDHRRAVHPDAGKKRRPRVPGVVGMSPRSTPTAAGVRDRGEALVEAKRRRVALGLEKPGGRTCRRGCGLLAVTGPRGRFANLCHQHDLEERRLWREQIVGRAA